MAPGIERLQAGDVPAIIELWKRAGLPYKPRGRDREELLAHRIEKGTDVFFGIRDRGRLIAVVLVTHDGRKGWINRLAVDPDMRRRGLAKALVDACEEFLAGESIEIYAVLIEDYNAPSLALFRELGYVLHEDIHYLSKRVHPDV